MTSRLVPSKTSRFLNKVIKYTNPLYRTEFSKRGQLKEMSFFNIDFSKKKNVESSSIIHTELVKLRNAASEI